MAQTIEERLSQLEKAHSRLFNQYQNLLKDFEDLKKFTQQLDNSCHIKIKEINLDIAHLKLSQPKADFIDGNKYQDVIEEIITIEKVDWNNKTCLNLSVKLKSRPELYKTFVLEKNKPRINDKVTFIYNAEEKKLTKLKCL